VVLEDSNTGRRIPHSLAADTAGSGKKDFDTRLAAGPEKIVASWLIRFTAKT
jgi:hypothetical protein